MERTSFPNLRTNFKTLDGRYTLHSERTVGVVPFQAQRFTRTLLARITPHFTALVFNVGDIIYIFDAKESEGEGVDVSASPVRTVQLATGSARSAYITCMAFHPASKDSQGDLLVGLSGGEVLLLSLRQQMHTGASHTKPCQVGIFSGGATSGEAP